MRRFQLFLISAAVVAGNASIAACSSDDSGQNDAGPDVVTKKDSGVKDSGPDVSPEAGPVITPAGKQIASSDSVQVFGVTSDNLVVYSDNGNGASLYAADATGTNPAVLIASPTVSASATYIVGVAGKVVFLWEGIATTANAPQVGKLSTWTSAGGLHPITLKSAASAGFASSTDGSKIIYSANSNTAGTVGDFVGSNTDGTTPVTLVTQKDVAATTCTPSVGFAGGVNPVTAVCDAAPPDGGTPAATITSYTPAWAPTVALTNALNIWSSDDAGDKLLLATPTTLSIFPINSAVGVPLDALHSVQNGFAFLKKDGGSAFYGTSAGDMWTVSTTTPVPTQLITSGVKVLRSISTDNNYVIYHTNTDSKQFGSDLYMHSTSAAGASTTLVGTTTGALFGLNTFDNFTSDSSRVLFITNVDTSAFVGDLNVMPVTGGAAVKLASQEWLNLDGLGTKIAFNDNCQGCGTNSSNQVIGIADIKAVDVAAATPTPTMLQAGADPQIFMAATKDHVIFTFSQNPPGTGDDGGAAPKGNGLYTIAMP